MTLLELEMDRSIRQRVQDQVRRLDEVALTSPLKAATAGAAIGTIVAIVVGRDVPKSAIIGAAVGTIAAASHRAWYLIGYSCGFCQGAEAYDELQDRMALGGQ